MVYMYCFVLLTVAIQLNRALNFHNRMGQTSQRHLQKVHYYLLTRIPPFSNTLSRRGFRTFPVDHNKMRMITSPLCLPGRLVWRAVMWLQHTVYEKIPIICHWITPQTTKQDI